MTRPPDRKPGRFLPGDVDEEGTSWSRGGTGPAALNQPEDVPDHIPGRVPHQRRTDYRVLSLIAAVLIAVMIGVTCVDVVGRYLLNAPFGPAYELTQLALAALVFIALPLTTADGGHVEVDLALHLFRRRIQRLLGRLAGWVSAVVLAYFAWRMVLLGLNQIGDGARTADLGLPLAPLAFLAAASCGLSAIIMAVRSPE
ncbi:TRAP transporter small permease [Paracoccus jeotgali]|uniref:TRAP transporter small permease protein n=1 Tax=Paracoccus jeotgali TaxID=2065379 RepID=A0A2K9MHS9_9RHOB|nr:TRAP transporter small permease [Paracoccus jeotgali]AUM75183.1 TRAP transporter small permease [Paracoccus jeotgali]